MIKVDFAMERDEKSGAAKKRASSVGGARGTPSDQDEEIMVERFFQLVASLREARNRLIRKEAEIITTRVGDQSGKKEGKRKRTTSSSSSAEEIGDHCWRGEFEREDFASEAELIRVPSLTTTTEMRQREKDATKRRHNEIKRHHDDHVVVGLNLDLTL